MKVSNLISSFKIIKHRKILLVYFFYILVFFYISYENLIFLLYFLLVKSLKNKYLLMKLNDYDL